jgi:type III secretion system low calcium response chaperone LcrH/SycD
MLSALTDGATLGDVFNITKDNLEAGYGLAYTLYNSGNFKDAGTLFSSLCLYDHTCARFWMGLAGCRQAEGDLSGAIDAYAFAAYYSALGDPAPAVHGALCYLKLGDRENARALFKASLCMSVPGNSRHAAHAEKAKAMLEMLDRG